MTSQAKPEAVLQNSVGPEIQLSPQIERHKSKIVTAQDHYRCWWPCLGVCVEVAGAVKPSGQRPRIVRIKKVFPVTGRDSP
jgi:hypothetical protein